MQLQPFDKFEIAEVRSVSPEAGTMVVESHEFGGARTVRIPHPFMSLNAWIRVMPEPGAYVILARRKGTKFEVECLGFVDPDEYAKTEMNIKSEVNNSGNADTSRVLNGDTFPYRVLQQGEFEIQSKGLAKVFGSRRGLLQLQGGQSQLTLHNDFQEINARTQTYRVTTVDHRHDRVANESRFGIMKRPSDNDPDGWDKLIKRQGEFAREHLEVLEWRGTPSRLYDRRRGWVYDDQGRPIQHQYTGDDLRMKNIYYTQTSTQVVDAVDIRGNVSRTLPEDATYGYHINVPGTASDIRINCGRDWLVTFKRDVTEKYGRHWTVEVAGNTTIKTTGNTNIHSDGPMNLTSGTSINITAPNVQIN